MQRHDSRERKYFDDEDCTRTGFEQQQEEMDVTSSFDDDSRQSSSFYNSNYKEVSSSSRKRIPPPQMSLPSTSMDVDYDATNASEQARVLLASPTATNMSTLSSSTSAAATSARRQIQYSLPPFTYRAYNGGEAVVVMPDERTFALMLGLQKAVFLRDLIQIFPTEKNNDLIAVSIKKVTTQKRGEKSYGKIIFRFVQPALYSIEHTVRISRKVFKSCSIPASFCIRIAIGRLKQLLPQNEGHSVEEIVALVIQDAIPLDVNGSIKSNSIHAAYFRSIKNPEQTENNTKDSSSPLICQLQLEESGQQLFEESIVDSGNELLLAESELESRIMDLLPGFEKKKKVVKFEFSNATVNVLCTFLNKYCVTYSGSSTKTPQLNTLELAFERNNSSSPITNITSRSTYCAVSVWNGMQSGWRVLESVQVGEPYEDFGQLKVLLDANLFHTIMKGRKVKPMNRNAGPVDADAEEKIAMTFTIPDTLYVTDNVIIKYRHIVDGKTKIILKPIVETREGAAEM